MQKLHFKNRLKNLKFSIKRTTTENLLNSRNAVISSILTALGRKRSASLSQQRYCSAIPRSSITSTEFRIQSFLPVASCEAKPDPSSPYCTNTILYYYYTILILYYTSIIGPTILILYYTAVLAQLISWHLLQKNDNSCDIEMLSK